MAPIDRTETLNDELSMEMTEEVSKIKVVGVGGAGCNAINRMIEDGISHVEYIAVNTDLQVLRKSLAKSRIQIGARSTQGLGAGARPEVGEKSAMEDAEEIKKKLDKANMVFITAGMGGGTGTGAAPVIAKIAREIGALTVAVVTIPFDFEGKRRIEQAMQGIERLREHVDTMLVISNSRIFQVIERKVAIQQAFHKIDEVLKQAVQGISNIIADTGIINVDFADVRTILASRGEAIMGIGSSSGENRAIEAARMALENPLIENSSFKNAGAMLVNIIGGQDFLMTEYNEAMQTISEYCREDAEIIMGMNVDPNLKEKVRVIIVATDFQRKAPQQEMSIPAESIFEDRKVVSLSEIRQERARQRNTELPQRPLRPAQEASEDLDVPAIFRSRRRLG